MKKLSLPTLYIITFIIFVVGISLIVKPKNTEKITTTTTPTKNIVPRDIIDSSFQAFDIYDETYGANVTFIVTQDLEKATKYIVNNQDSTFKVEELYGNDGKTIPRDDKQITIWLYQATYSPKDLAIVSHEVFHAASDILYMVGVPLGFDSNETYAYEISYLEREFYKHVKIK